MLGVGIGINRRPLGAANYAKQLAKAYEARVIADGGVVESLGCFTAFATALGAFKPTLLLDFYQNAAAAYSLRKLSTTYTGDAIRVRRASDNTEQDIGFVNNVLDTASLTTFCSGTDGFVTTWYDQSGNAVDATQATAASQPQIVSSGSVVLENGKAAVDFEYSTVRTPLNLNISLAIATSDFMVLGVVKNKTNETNNYIDSSTDGMDILYLSNYPTIAKSGVAQILQQSTAVNNTDMFLINFMRHGGSIYNYLNGGNQVSTTDSTDFSAKIDFIGDDEVIIQELIIYKSDQSSNRTGIETNIAQFYNISLSS